MGYKGSLNLFVKVMVLILVYIHNHQQSHLFDKSTYFIEYAKGDYSCIYKR